MTHLSAAAQLASPAAAAVPGLEIELVHSERGARAAVDLLAKVWTREDGEQPLPPELAWVFAHSGNYVALAHRDGRPVGAAIGFRGADERGDLLHSHITGVLPDHQGAQVGFTLKQHQRRWSLAEGIDRITWTFDPLVARNAYFNVSKLAARITDYYVDFYGPMDDGINAGDETDRCLVEWNLTDPRVEAAAAGQRRTAETAASAAVPVLAPDADLRPLVDGPTDATARLVRLPADIVGMRQRDPHVAQQWRHALRRVLQDAFADGLEIVAVGRDSSYLLARSAEPLI